MTKRYSSMLIVCITVCLTDYSPIVNADDLVVTHENQTISRPISPPSSKQADHSKEDSSARTGSFVTTLGALGLILMIFLGLVQMWKKRSPQSVHKLPGELWQELGSARLDYRYQVRLVRVGSRILVLGQSESNLQTLSEITEPEEVANLVAQCAPQPDKEQQSKFQALYEQFRSRIHPTEQARRTTASLSSGESHGA